MQIFKDRFKDKVALVTGGASGIGEAIAKRYVAEGGKVALFGRTESKLNSVVEEIGSENAYAIVVDVSNKEAVEKAVAQVVEHFGRIDSLFNCAAITYRRPLVDLEEEPYKKVIDTNVNGSVYVTQSVAKIMIDKGIRGSILLLSSMDAFICSPTNPTYAITKGAIVSMTRTFAVSLIKYGIRVNCLAPGFTETPFVAETMADPEKLKIFTGNIPIGRVADVDEQAGPALFLASDDASYIVGHTLLADGGSVITH